MARLLRSALREIAADTRGTSLIELSFIIPLLVVLACGASDMALAFTRGVDLQQAAARTMEYAVASGYKSGFSSVTTLQAEGAAAAGVPTGNVTIDTWLECAGVRQSSYSGTCTNTSPSRFASVTITDTYTWIFGSLIPTYNQSNRTIALRGYAEVRIQ